MLLLVLVIAIALIHAGRRGGAALPAGVSVTAARPRRRPRRRPWRSPPARLEPQVEALLAADPTLHLVDLTAVGGAGTDSPLRAVYQLRSAAGNRIRLTATGAGELPGLAHIWPAADWPEREMAGRFGMRIEGREDLRPLFPAPPAMVPGEMPPPPEGEVPIPDPSEATPFRLDLGGAPARRPDPKNGHGPPGTAPQRLRETRREPYLGPAASAGREPQRAGAVRARPGGDPRRRGPAGDHAAAPVHLGAHAAGRDQPASPPTAPGLANLAGPDSVLWGQALDRPGGGGAPFSPPPAAAAGPPAPSASAGSPPTCPPAPAACSPTWGAAVDRLRADALRGTVDHRGWAPPLLRRRGSRRRRGPWAPGPRGRPARAAGIDLDVRRTEPYLAYGEVRFGVPTADSGDVVERTRVRIEEMGESLSIARQCLAGAPRRTDPGPRGPPADGCAPRSPPS